jgi:hypothetical protein
MRLAAMQENSHRSNGDVGGKQSKNKDLPPSPI